MHTNSIPTRFAIAGGTWSGYAPLKKAVSDRPDPAYALQIGLSDIDRIELLTHGTVSAILITLPALAEIENVISVMDPVVVHVFARSISQDGAERVLVNSKAPAQTEWRWALPSRGFEKAIVVRLDPEASTGGRWLTMDSRSSSLIAVAGGDADACIADLSYARTVLGERLQELDCRPLPEELWQDIWTVLVVPRSVLLLNGDELQTLVRQMSADAQATSATESAAAHYPTPAEARELIASGAVHDVYRRWGGQTLAATAALFE